MKRLTCVTSLLPAIALVVLLPMTSRPQWSSAVNIAPGAAKASLNESMGQCLVTCGDTVHVAWVDRRGIHESIWYTRSIDTGHTWSTPIAVTDTNGTGVWPVVAASGQFVHIAWLDTSLGHPASWYKRSTDGGVTWGNKFCLDSNTKFWPGMAASGNLVVTSLNKDVSGNTEVFFRASSDNGATWSALKQISNATGRSEDPAIDAVGDDVYLSWNDNRKGPMEIFFRHSSDRGATWGPEFSLIDTTPQSYSTSVHGWGSSVDVVYGDRRTGTFEAFIRLSSNNGGTFGPEIQLTTGTEPFAYPVSAHSGTNVHVACYQIGGTQTTVGPWYTLSTNNGTSWSTPISMGHGGQPFVAVSGSVVHLVWPDSGRILYRRNPTGNPGAVVPPADPPTAPQDLTTNCTPGVWSTLSSLSASWTASTSAHSTIAGYGYLLDHTPGTEPTVVNTIPASVVLPVEDGRDYYFHVRAFDVNGAGSTTAHLGPMFYDHTAPLDPVIVSSTVPVSTWTPLWLDTLRWRINPSDTLHVGGLKGFSATVSGAWDTMADSTVSLVTESQLFDLPEGISYIHLRSIDSVNHCSPTMHIGPLKVDRTAPTARLWINNGASQTNSSSVRLTLTASDGASGVSTMQFSNNGVDWSDPVAYSTIGGNWDLAAFGGSATQGTKRVQVRVFDNAGNNGTADTTIDLLNPNGVGDALAGSPGSTSIFPNPAIENIVLTSSAADIERVVLLDPLGREAVRVNAAHGSTVDVPLASVPAGMYVIRIVQRNGFEAPPRIVNVIK